MLWVAGFEVLPWLHVALHDHLAPHHHDLAGATLPGADPVAVAAPAPPVAGAVDDDLDAEVDEHGVPVQIVVAAPRHVDATPHAIVDAHARLAAALAHGAHSLAHHGIAVPVPATAITHPLPIDRRPTFVAREVAAAPISCPPPLAVARGPPGARLG